MRAELIQKLWQDIWGPLTIREVMQCLEHVLRKRGDMTELEIAEVLGRSYGNFFRARERMVDGPDYEIEHGP